MFRFCHRLALFDGLSPSDPAHYGFTHTQVAVDPFTPGDADAVVDYASRIPTSLKLLLAFTPKPDNELFSARVSDAWLTTLDQGVRAVADRLPGRVVAVRWNHEYRPSAFAQTAEWEAWMKARGSALFTYVTLYQRPKWNQLLIDTREKIHPVSFLESTTGTDWDKPSNTDFRKVFQYWVDYQCQREAVIINRIAANCQAMGLPFYLYPGGWTNYSPRLLPKTEYTMDQYALSPTFVILEAGGWSTRNTTWLQDVAASIRPSFIWTNQLDLRSLAGADPAPEYALRMSTANYHGQPPLGFGFWSDWNPTLQPEFKIQMQRYMDGLKEMLNP